MRINQNSFGNEGGPVASSKPFREEVDELSATGKNLEGTFVGGSPPKAAPKMLYASKAAVASPI